MRVAKKPSVLVCVTGQYDCDRLIEAGFELAAERDCDLHVLCVHNPTRDMSSYSDEIEYLYRTAKSLGADMTVLFHANAPRCTADFARRINAKHLVTGMPDSRPNGFVLTVNELLPKLPVTMVTEDGERLLYALDHASAALA
ncbi:universal stress protein [uncultured Ruminococcus sp.]|uniref:universal stress protein n=1 Tax=uncultured Ruminococcus sp. TaxID=165186 RepID=UPI00292E942C|nr:universal stress protein [uncultured Ruminococcus sp.]